MEQSDSLSALQNLVNQFVEQRNWRKHHQPKNLAMSIAIEAAELMEIFQWIETTDDQKAVLENSQIRQRVADEIADVIIYCLSLATATNIDLNKAVRQKMERNHVRFPVDYKLK